MNCSTFWQKILNTFLTQFDTLCNTFSQNLNTIVLRIHSDTIFYTNQTFQLFSVIHSMSCLILHSISHFLKIFFPAFIFILLKVIHSFQKVLGTYDLISLGVGSCAGTGMYLVSGMVAKTMAGPAVVLSYLIAGSAALLSGLCYAELGVRVPHTTGKNEGGIRILQSYII